jgi:hypothetical protein
MLLLTQSIKTTIKAQTVMTAYHFATFGAVPLYLFLFQKPLDAMLFNKFEVLNHAHFEICSVAVIKML